MRLTLVISSLGAGGAERAMTLMANHWAREGQQITLLTFDDGSASPFYELDSRINQLSLSLSGDSTNLFAAVWNNLRRVRKLRSAIRRSRPECVISSMDQVNVLTLLATRSLRIPVIVMEHTYSPLHHIGRAWEVLRNKVYPSADRVVALTEPMLRCFSPRIQARGCVIPNPILSPRSNDESRCDKLMDSPALLAIGRLSPEKGFDVLLRAFAQVGEQYAGWTLTILGEGDLRRELEALRLKLNLTNRVQFRGLVPNPEEFMRQADLFVMASRYEGFPMALCEAMSYGLPAISADCPTGPREIIRDGVDGFLVPTDDSLALASALERLMSDEGLRRLMGQRARAITERFGITRIMKMWDALLNQVINNRA